MAQDESARAILSAKLKEYRKRSGLTIFDVGEKLKKSPKTISAWENGHGQPDAEMFVELYYLYQMDSMSEFWGITDKGMEEDETELLKLYRGLNSTGKNMLLASARAYAKSGDYTESEQEDPTT